MAYQAVVEYVFQLRESITLDVGCGPGETPTLVGRVRPGRVKWGGKKEVGVWGRNGNSYP